MSFKKTSIVKRIATNLAILSKSVSLENTVGFFDSNRGAQELFKDLFNLVYGYNLVELDIEYNISNYPAIDLGDERTGLAIQVTRDSSSTKIKDAINIFQTHPKCQNYTRLVVYIIGNKKNYTATFHTNGKFIFNPNDDIWDDTYFINELNKISEITKLEAVEVLLNERLEKFIFPEILIPEDIEACISILKRDFGSSTDIKIKVETRGNLDYIVKKNAINNISWEFFKEKIQNHIKYNNEINEFLSNPINRNSQEDYFAVTQAIQDYYHSKKSQTTFEQIFRDVFSTLNTYDDEVSGITIKMKIMLHNMYFNCDIGDNPNENS